jgi:hypothetical protein
MKKRYIFKNTQKVYNTLVKTCTQCKESKSLNAFRKQFKTKDGHKYRCRECDDLAAREYYKREKGKIISNAKKWQADNPDKVREYKKKYYGRTIL